MGREFGGLYSNRCDTIVPSRIPLAIARLQFWRPLAKPTHRDRMIDLLELVISTLAAACSAGTVHVGHLLIEKAK
jgi:hypothetical protein